jgi:putative acetyltransferase
MATIRSEHEGDLAGIRAVHLACFPTDAEANLVDQLRSAGRLVVSLVAEDTGALVGHIGFSPVTVVGGLVGAGLAPVAVLAGYRRQGIAGELVRCGLVACRVAGFGWAAVLGEPAYYTRFGFLPAPNFGLWDEYGGGPAFQTVELTSGAMPTGAGLVRYAPEFAALGGL